ncbi:MAG: alpha-amylase [Clostridia bacterium]|nr:alpha-amylase [Clostridia bacterium]
MKLRNMTLYSIFVRNDGGTFAAVERDLPRLKALGVDAIWLMPIHPIGTEKRKGSLGSPYAISDYRAINPEFGTMDDFTHLCDAAHALGLKVLIDVVYHHTSPDSVLRKTHPEYFYRKPDGSFGNHVGDWTDIIDLDFDAKPLWDELIDTLCFWANYVDGFRCDVAPLVPLGFWLEARRRVAGVRSDCIWLAESVEHGFIRYNRAQGLAALSDSELYQAFDICYDYDIYETYLAYAQGRGTLADYVAALERQESTYPADYVKLRFTENHDRLRTAFLFPDRTVRENWLSWTFFQKGMPLLYSGQEWAPNHTPTLFDPDPIEKNGEPMHGQLLKTLIAMKKDPLFADGVYTLEAKARDVILSTWTMGERKAVGVFSMRGQSAAVAVPLADGCYRNILNGRDYPVDYGTISTAGEPIILMN